MRQEFKAGDKVYCPKSGFRIYTVRQEEEMDVTYQLYIRGAGYRRTFTRSGHSSSLNITPDIFHATPENHELLTKLYGVEFEAPPKRKTAKEVIQAMLDNGWACVPCYVSDFKEKPSAEDYADLITSVNGEQFEGAGGLSWDYASPVDPKTGKSIIDYIDGEIVTE